MDISAIATSVNANNFTSFSTAGADFHRSERMEGASETRYEREYGHHDKGRQGLALGVFKQKLEIELKTHFHARLSSTQQAYGHQKEQVSADEVAEDALGSARQLVAEEPAKAAKSLISFRAKVEESASYVRETVGDYDDVTEVDKAAARIDQGLSKLEGEVAANRESTASVLEMDTRSKQRSSIKIRTQEGDIVKLSLRQVNRSSASDLSYSNNEVSFSATEVAASSRSRMKLKVEGDLNEAEMAAIQNVFAQAESIANEFFGGDISAAFNIAQGFEFDASQLARVNMGFKMSRVSNVHYAETTRVAAPAPAPDSSAPAVTGPAPAVTGPAPAEPATPPAAVAAAPVEQAARPDGEDLVPASAATDSAAAEAPSGDAISAFFDQLTAFMRTVGEGFADAASSASYTYHYSESFKLSLLKAVVHTVAPDDAENAASNVGAVIDQISASKGSESA